MLCAGCVMQSNMKNKNVNVQYFILLTIKIFALFFNVFAIFSAHTDKDSVGE